MPAQTQRLLQCTICAYNQAGHPKDPPKCPQHPDRYLVAQKFLVNGPKDFLLGSVLNDKYIITHPLGQGQYGRVYGALQQGAAGIKRPVAIKVLREDRSEAQALFLDEMKVIATLDSKHIVRYLDSSFDSNHGITYMVMELIEGDTLSQRLDESVLLHPHRVTRLISQLLIALDEAHQAGVIHRDLKPSNVMLTYVDGEEVLKVLDFGVARPHFDQPREQTQGVIPGTPAYMAPELFSKYDGQLSPQMDLFSVGVIFYQALMGHLPFSVEGQVDHLIGYYKLYSSSPSPIPMASHVPKGLREIVFRALSLDPKRRYPSAKAMLEALKPWAPTAHSHLEANKTLARIDQPDSAPTKVRRINWLIAAAVLGGALGLGAHFIYGKGSSQFLGQVFSQTEEPVEKPLKPGENDVGGHSQGAVEAQLGH